MQQRASFFATGFVALCSWVSGCGPSEPCVGGACKGADAGDDASADASSDAPVDATAGCNGPPGLYASGSCSVLATGVVAYQPLFVLWSDGAAKTRFVYLPPGTTIDTTDPDAWVYPQGTRLYKHFDFSGRHVETRMLEKTGTGEGASAWSMRTFGWNYAQDTATEITNGASNVLGTMHDIPPVAVCADCHASGGGGASATRGMRDVALSFSAIQLNHDAAGVTLASLSADGRLSTAVSTTAAVIPGDATTRAGLGYLHTNCGPCHNGLEAPPSAASPLRFWVPVGTATPDATPTYLTAVGQAATTWTVPPNQTLRIAPHDATDSMVIVRMMQRGSYGDSGVSYQMPPVATEAIDNNGISIVSAWIATLP